ncbi:MAG TPA: cupredoxin domain-containing protein [Caulobacteraceae bacterium]
MRLPWRAVMLAGAAGLCAVAPSLAAKDKAGKLLVVQMTNLAYAPETISAHVGDRIAWANHDMFIHSATTPDFTVVLKPGTSGGVRLLKPGTINYICTYHPGMKGQIVVVEK